MAQSSQLGLTEEQARTPIHVNGELLTLQEAAQHLRSARLSDDPDQEQVLILAAELARLRQDSKEVGDSVLVGAADALEKSARKVLIEEQ
jgi:hypothetical protein